MPSIKIQPFSATLPKLSAELLPNDAAQIASNVKLMSGEVRAWRKPVKKADLIVANALSIYKLYGASGAKFLSWAADVNVVGSPLSDASDYRAYYAGESTPRKTNWALAVSGGGPYPFDYLELGVPAPSSAPTLTVSNGTGTAETRVYLITNVSTFGSIKEESGPSAVATCSIQPTGGSVLLNAFPAAPGGKYNITHRRIYRSLVGTSDYGFVTEIPVATTSYSDTALTGSSTSLLPSLYWTPPPSGLKGLVSMPNGMIAGFSGNEVWFCEPYYPHAWPVRYMLTVDYPIIGLGVYGNNLVVVTDNMPYVMSGTHPSAMSQEMIKIPEPCISKRSIANNENGVLYATPNGIMGIGPGVRGLVSEYAYTRDEWQDIIPATLFGVLFGKNYILFNSAHSAATRHAIVIQSSGQSGVSGLNSPSMALHVDRKTGDLYSVSELDGALYQLDADSTNLEIFDWKSKKFVVPQPVNFSCLQVNCDFTYLGNTDAINAAIALIVAANIVLYATGAIKAGEMNGARFNKYQFNANQLANIPSLADYRSVTAVVYADGVVVFSANIDSFDPVRMGDGFKASTWELEVTGNVPVKSIAVATSIAELKGA